MSELRDALAALHRDTDPKVTAPVGLTIGVEPGSRDFYFVTDNGAITLAPGTRSFVLNGLRFYAEP